MAQMKPDLNGEREKVRRTCNTSLLHTNSDKRLVPANKGILWKK